jgi:hypothetical protein
MGTCLRTVGLHVVILTKLLRCVQVILPFTVGIVNLVAHSYDLDPLMVFMGLSETVSPFRFSRLSRFLVDDELHG